MPAPDRNSRSPDHRIASDRATSQRALKEAGGGADRPRMRPETAENRRCPAGSGDDPAPTGSGAAVHQNFGGNPNVIFV